MNQAVIDIGTNSARLLIYAFESGKVKRICKTVRYTRMGENLNRTGVICSAAMQRNQEALAEFKTIMTSYGVADAYVFGTSALRDASNSAVFVDLIDETLQFKVDIISGEQEAIYGFLGVAQSFDEPVLIFDIGGGSTEFIAGCGSQMEKMISLNMGCVRGTEQYLKHEVPEAEEMAALAIDMDLRLKGILPDFESFRGRRLVGIGGTATTLAAIDREMTVYNGDEIHKRVLTKESLDKMIEKMAALPLRERKKIKGLDEKRADIIVAGSVILDRILAAFQADVFTLCDYDNLEGAAFAKHTR